MSEIFRVHVLPAQRGDALWIDYGSALAPRSILIDGGIASTGRTHLQDMLAARKGSLDFELLVITHVDLDHIQGVIELLENLPPGVNFNDIWFNGWDQLPSVDVDSMGIKEGIGLSDLLKQHHAAVWNKAANGRAISLDANDNVVRHFLCGGMTVSVLGPTHSQLARLREQWSDVVEAFGADERAEADGTGLSESEPLAPGLEAMGPIDVLTLAKSTFTEDDAIPNGSSIALSLEFNGKCALMLADAYPSVIARSIQRISPECEYVVDLVKLAHHGSRNNTDRRLASLLSAPRWVFSSNGASNTKHPHREAVARVLCDGNGDKTLVFNYRTTFNEVWDDAELKDAYGYATIYGDGQSPVVLNLL